MDLSRLVYFSSATGPGDVGGILTAAKLNNKRKQITGALWFDGNFFLQVLEGDRSTISETFQRISKDPRHKDIILVECKSIEDRQFSQWTMGYYADTHKNRAHILKYSNENVFDPRFMTSENLVRMMTDRELVKLLA
ncbi:MAG: BLUF domain-containing protein [Rhodomicrobiaceae bacterium]